MLKIKPSMIYRITGRMVSGQIRKKQNFVVTKPYIWTKQNTAYQHPMLVRAHLKPKANLTRVA